VKPSGSIWAGLATMVAAIAVTTAAIFGLRELVPVVSTGVLYLLAVLLVSSYWGFGLGVLTSILSAAAFNWFHIPPTGHFTIAESENWVALVVYLVTALVASTLAGAARSRAEEAERRRGEAEQATAELEALAGERDRMQVEAIEAEALRRSDELKTALLRSVSHDLRTPLTSVIAAGAALASPTLTEAERGELSEAVVAEGNRLSRLVENLLDVSRLEAGKAAPRREPVDIAEVLEAARDSIGADSEAVRLTVDPDLPTLEADAAQLERAFANLIENGVRHGGGRPVLARCRLVGPRVVVRVVDQGPGIPEPERERIFEPFYRAADGAVEQTGFGLGLAIAKGFVEANGGEVAVESLPGQGSSFVVTFPHAMEGSR
jgi:two-component system, OmpR family, sensor histidine kinase KdpD